MKTCPDCLVEKPATEFHRNRAMAGGVEYYCKPCRAERRKKYQDRERAYGRSYNQGRKASRRRLLTSVKLTAGCTDCGYTEHPHALQFDHVVPATKSFPMSTFGTVGWDVFWAELEKCDVRCANCHAIRTERLRERQPVGAK